MPRLFHRTARLAALLTAASLVSSCDLAYALSSGCSDELRSAIRLDIVDSINGKPAAAGATVWLRGASLVDSLTVPDSVTDATARYWMENIVKAGRYAIEIQKPGYRSWTRDDIRITANRCHVTNFAFVTARLQRS